MNKKVEELLSTGLFAEEYVSCRHKYDIKEFDNVKIYKLPLLNGTYYLEVEGDKLRWGHDLCIWYFDFETVFESCSPEIREQLIYHLDILR